PSSSPASVEYRKCQPRRTRESAHSNAAARKLANVRVGIPGGAVVVTIVKGTSWPMRRSRIPKEAAQAVACAEMYSGNGGVVRSGSQLGSASVRGLSSTCASRTAVYGRQWLYSYFASHTAT